MPRKASEAIFKGNVPIPQQEEYGSGQSTLADAYRHIKLMMSHFEEQTELLKKRLTRLEHGARQSRVAMDADGPANTKTQKRTEGAATAVQAMHGDSCTVTNRSIKILELVNYREGNGDKTRSPPLDSRGRVIRTKKGLNPRSKARLDHSFSSPCKSNSANCR